MPKPIRRFCRNILYLKLIFTNRQSRLSISNQQMLSFNSSVELSTNPKTLKDIFHKAGMKYREGCHLTYIYRKEDIEKINKNLIKTYPERFGLKIFFSTDIASDGSVYYISNRHYCDNRNAMYTKSVGTIKEKMVISNILSISGMAPRVYDIITLKYKNILLQAMVVEHIEGSLAQGREGLNFLKKAYTKLEEENIEIISEKTLTPQGFQKIDIDFAPPKFNYNIVKSDKGLRYIDIQNFRLNRKRSILKIFPDIKEKTHFGESLPFRGKRYPYQSIPFLGITGKRNTTKRLKRIDDLLSKNDICFSGKNILDVGCNLGMFISHSLNKGASWCTGLDFPEIINVAKRSLLYQGFSRFDLIGCDLKKEKITFIKQKYEIIFYLSISHHIGFPDWLDRVGFKYLIFDGKENQSIPDAESSLLERFPNSRVIARDRFKDGDCKHRPFIIIANK